MSFTIVVRDIDPGDKSWLEREAGRTGMSIEEFVRCLVREKRAKTERSMKPSEAFARFFGPEHGADLPPPASYACRPVEFADEGGV